MASNDLDVLQQLQLNCQTFEELEIYIQHYGLDQNHPAVVTRRSELINAQLISDGYMDQVLKCCCHTLEDLNSLVQEGLDTNDPTVRARQQVLQV